LHLQLQHLELPLTLAAAAAAAAAAWPPAELLLVLESVGHRHLPLQNL
jgi:hypothetical protein